MKTLKKILALPILLYLWFVICMQWTAYREYMLQYCALHNPWRNDEVIMLWIFIAIPAMFVWMLVVDWANQDDFRL